jgi:polyhydroxyalkanoate synthesis regulator phasin
LTKKSEINLGHAKMVIDDLRMLRDKTKGNIDRDEDAHLTKILSDLQFQFVEKSKGA